ncbi:MAG TPA: HAD family phosphatase [Myxococcales bacterium LLY-WYZ-16_1]|nr:HAD family phosphatase [Myxococcales bacterium LLY-WYZ-16_1]
MKYVVFDLGGVLVDWNPRHLFRKLMPAAEMERFLGEVATPEWNAKMDAGKPFADAIAERAVDFPDDGPWLRAYFERWPEMLGGPIEGTVTLLETLDARGVPLYALTNWSAETFHHAERRFSFLQRFQDILVSGREGLVKPHPEVYLALLRRNRLRPEHGVFIDDVAANVEGARQVGLDGIRFEGPARLRGDLNRRGLL